MKAGLEEWNSSSTQSSTALPIVSCFDSQMVGSVMSVDNGHSRGVVCVCVCVCVCEGGWVHVLCCVVLYEYWYYPTCMEGRCDS